MGIVVLSLFDGCACAKVALDRAGIPVDTYYASEIDKYAIKVALKNHPDIIQLGNISHWQTWDIKQPDLIIGGSPCQDLSIASHTQTGIYGNRSSLFFDFVNIRNMYSPKYFLLENVNSMKAIYAWIFSFYLGVKPIRINSALLSAQLRDRLYWTNIKNVILPDNTHRLLKHVIQTGITDRDKAYCIDANYGKGTNYTTYKKGRRQIVYHQSATPPLYYG